MEYLYKILPDLHMFRKKSTIIKVPFIITLNYLMAIMVGFIVTLVIGDKSAELAMNIGFIVFMFVAFVSMFEGAVMPIIPILSIAIMRAAECLPYNLYSDVLYKSQVGTQAIYVMMYINIAWILIGVGCHATYISSNNLWDRIHEEKEKIRNKNKI